MAEIVYTGISSIQFTIEDVGQHNDLLRFPGLFFRELIFLRISSDTAEGCVRFSVYLPDSCTHSK